MLDNYNKWVYNILNKQQRKVFVISIKEEYI